MPDMAMAPVTTPRPAAPEPEASVRKGMPEPPTAKIAPHELEQHGHRRVDDYYWLKKREDPEVVSYLEAENAYFDAVMQHTEPLQETLYEEIVGRIKKDDNSVPYKRDGYYYYTRFVEGGEYPLHCRKKGTLDAEEEIMLDGNELAAGHEFFALRGLRVSSGQDILAYGVDTVGRRFYTLKLKNLTTGESLPDVIPDVTPNSAWANDNRTLFYTRQHPDNLRWYRIYRHVLGTDPAEDELVYEEADETFTSFVYKTRSKKFVMIGSFQTLSSELRYLDADDPAGEPRILEPRQRDHEYGVDHYGDYFYIRTNHQAKNFRLMKTPITDTGMASWQEVIPHRDDVFLDDIELFRDHMVVSERREGLLRMRVVKLSSGEEHDLDFGEPAYLAFASDNYDFDTNILRYRYSSMTTPWSTFDYDLDSKERTLLKQQEVLGGFDSATYVTERLSATARDGERIPVSLVYRKGTARDGSSPLLLYAYGSYGATIDPTFNSARLSLLDRGFVFATAHIRGGQVMGRHWYEDGKLLKKKNTFRDFIDAGEYLIAEGYTEKDRLFALGGSAGGLLMGAVVNMRPDLFSGVIAHVPFVDAITTMLDPDIPLTAGEWDEWGDPRKKEYYDYILSYSPYDNVEAKAYPHLMVTTGLHDSQVQYWEPAKWVAKLRAMKTDDNRLLLHTNMEAGHGGATGRFKRHRETARDYAFLLDLAGVSK
ncbi:MAG: S9 family peptidase [bacterium]|nr:S9 family peptidase [bacterium]